MRTRIFNKFTDLPPEFQEDFLILWNLSEDTRNALITYVSRIYKEKTTAGKKTIIDEAVSVINYEIPAILKTIKLLTYIYSTWNPFQDSSENFIKDIEELDLIPKEKAEEGKKFFEAFINEIKGDNTRRLQKMYAGSHLPNIEAIDTVTDFRAVFKNSYRLGDDIGSYEPKFVDFTPIIIIKIYTDADESKNFTFQCEPDDIKYIIATLQSSLKDISAVKKILRG